MKNQKVKIDISDLEIDMLNERVKDLEAQLATAKASARAWYNVARSRVNRHATQKGA